VFDAGVDGNSPYAATDPLGWTEARRLCVAGLVGLGAAYAVALAAFLVVLALPGS
jgi:hypothetical protein